MTMNKARFKALFCAILCTLGFTVKPPPIKLCDWCFVPGLSIWSGAGVVGTQVTSNAFAAGIVGTNNWRFLFASADDTSDLPCTTWTNTYWGITNMTAYPFFLGCQGHLVIAPPGSYYRVFAGAGPNTNYEFVNVINLNRLVPPVFNISFAAMSTAHQGNNGNASHDDVVLDAGTLFQAVIGQTLHTNPPVGPFMRYETVGSNSYVTHAGQTTVGSNQFTYYWGTYNCSNYMVSEYYNQASNYTWLGSNWESMAPTNVQSTSNAVQTGIAKIEFYFANLHQDPESNDLRWAGPIFFCYNKTNINLSPYGGY